ncbi:MAG TPA: hypothetical protein VGF94_24665 [Kofleriaceae bacterium]|jgi:hypothetical protein
MRCFALALFGVALWVHVAAADDAASACKARRHAIAMAAQQLATADERAALYATMPECVVRDDGSVEVIEPAPAAVDTSPMPRRFELAVASGIGETGVFPGAQALASGPGPVVEVEGTTWLRRHFGVTVFASATQFADANYRLFYTTTAPGMPGNPIVPLGGPMSMAAPVTDTVYDAGARLDIRYGRMTAGAGLGVVVEQATELGSYTDTLLGMDLAVAAHVGSMRGASVELRAFATYAPIALTQLDTDDYMLFSMRLAVGLRY